MAKIYQFLVQHSNSEGLNNPLWDSNKYLSNFILNFDKYCDLYFKFEKIVNPNIGQVDTLISSQKSVVLFFTLHCWAKNEYLKNVSNFYIWISFSLKNLSFSLVKYSPGSYPMNYKNICLVDTKLIEFQRKTILELFLVEICKFDQQSFQVVKLNFVRNLIALKLTSFWRFLYH